MRVPCCSAAAVFCRVARADIQVELWWAPNQEAIAAFREAANILADEVAVYCPHVALSLSETIDRVGAILSGRYRSRDEAERAIVEARRRLLEAARIVTIMCSREDGSRIARIARSIRPSWVVMRVGGNYAPQALRVLEALAALCRSTGWCRLDILWFGPGDIDVFYEAGPETPPELHALAKAAMCLAGLEECSREEAEELARMAGVEPAAARTETLARIMKQVSAKLCRGPEAARALLCPFQVDTDNIDVIDLAYYVYEAASLLGEPEIKAVDNKVELIYGVIEVKDGKARLRYDEEADYLVKDLAKLLDIESLTADIDSADELAKLVAVAAPLVVEDIHALELDITRVEDVYQEAKKTIIECKAIQQQR